MLERLGIDLRANPEINVGRLLQRINRLIELKEIGAVEYITTLDDGTEFVVKEGNKRTVAYFERFRAKGDVGKYRASMFFAHRIASFRFGCDV